MCDAHSSISINTLNQVDPTRTTVLRNAFVAESNRRFRSLHQAVTQVVSDFDFFGLNNPLQVNNIPNASVKIENFMQWLKEVENRSILDKGWVNAYIQAAYEKGIKRARVEMRKAGIKIQDVEQVENILGERVLSNLPYHIDRLNVLYMRVFTELEGITASMNEQIVRILSEGLIAGQSPRRMAQMINSAIIKSKKDLGLKISYVNKAGKQVTYFMSGRRRAEIMARTETIRAHHLANIQEYRRWKAFDVQVIAEHMTAGDHRVCPMCASLQGTTYSLDEAETMIPVHPQCRCIVIPRVVKDKKK